MATPDRTPRSGNVLFSCSRILSTGSRAQPSRRESAVESLLAAHPTAPSDQTRGPQLLRPSERVRGTYVQPRFLPAPPPPPRRARYPLVIPPFFLPFSKLVYEPRQTDPPHPLQSSRKPPTREVAAQAVGAGPLVGAMPRRLLVGALGQGQGQGRVLPYYSLANLCVPQQWCLQVRGFLEEWGHGPGRLSVKLAQVHVLGPSSEPTLSVIACRHRGSCEGMKPMQGLGSGPGLGQRPLPSRRQHWRLLRSGVASTSPDARTCASRTNPLTLHLTMLEPHPSLPNPPLAPSPSFHRPFSLRGS